MIVGFTGTRRGMTQAQVNKVIDLLEQMWTPGLKNEFHHGDCIGADEGAAEIAASLGYKTVAHPGFDLGYRSTFVSDVNLPERDYLERNLDIIEVAQQVIATPSGRSEIFRGSGTWFTIRRCRGKKALNIVYPDGELAYS